MLRARSPINGSMCWTGVSGFDKLDMLYYNGYGWKETLVFQRFVPLKVSWGEGVMLGIEVLGDLHSRL